MNNTTVTIKAGTHGNSGFFYVSNEAGEQIATYANSAKGIKLIATFANNREYTCSKEYRNVAELAKAKNWNIAE